jgi:glycogen debranching enzyme
MKRDYSQIKNEFIGRAKKIFTKNTFAGYSPYLKMDYKYISPAKTEYLFQWFWDTAFHAIVLSHFDLPWAKSEITNHLKAQDENGFIPHIVFWRKQFLPHWAYIESKLAIRPKHTAITQPPFLTIAAEEVFKKDQDKEFLKQVLPKFVKYHKWLLSSRDPDNDGLVSIISPNESGMDELPVFQVAIGFKGLDTARLHYYYRKADLLNHRYRYNAKKILEKDYFNVEDVLFNTVNIEAMRSLARLLEEVGEKSQAKEFETKATKAEASLLEQNWDEEDSIFYSTYHNNHYKAKVKTIASLAPLMLSGLDKKRVDLLVKGHLLNPEEFYLPYPIPSVAKNEVYFVGGETPRYKIKLLWRGPTWINTNWMVLKGLQKHGYDDLAQEIIDKNVEMISREGFREYYNPVTGEGYRRKDFGMSTTIIDLL